MPMSPHRTHQSIAAALASTREFLIDLVYPKRCAGCGRRGTWLCARCEDAIELFTPPWCTRCGVPLDRYECRCADLAASLQRVRSIGPYEGWLRGAVVQCKYHGEWARTAQLGRLLATVIADLLPCDALVPVPLHPTRMRQRGFNQSLLLAQHAGQALSVPVADHLFRSRRTEAQVHLAAAERARNVHGAFSVKPGPSLDGASFILIDDVFTTGATLAACADVLLAAGARWVAAGTVAREM
jgi:ComF family protein